MFSLIKYAFIILWSFGGLIGAAISYMHQEWLNLALSLVVPFYGAYITVMTVIERFF
ncbi:MAG: hypothetical protein JWM96_1049 [Alphaproteobacteria bacterium]|nr:hypothetical protein [Alphaproteobacteria bacterium]